MSGRGARRPGSPTALRDQNRARVVAELRRQGQATQADLASDRKLTLTHFMRGGVKLSTATTQAMLGHVRHLWGYEVELKEIAA